MVAPNDFIFVDPGLLVDDNLTLVLAETIPADPVKGFVPAYRFEMARRGRQGVIGHIHLRIGWSKHLIRYAGNVGYGVNLGHRGRRYAARACKLLLPLACSHGLEALWVTCNPDNWASRRTCELAGARLVEIVDLPEDTDMYRRGERQKCRYRLDL